MYMGRFALKNESESALRVFNWVATFNQSPTTHLEHGFTELRTSHLTLRPNSHPYFIRICPKFLAMCCDHRRECCGCGYRRGNSKSESIFFHW